MSKALLKKSLALVKSRKSSNDKNDLVKSGEKMGIKKKTQNRNSSTGFQRQSSSKIPKTAEVVSLVDKNMLYFTRRKRMKRKMTNTVSKTAVPEKRGKYLTPAQLALEKRRIRLDQKKMRETTRIKAEEKLKKRKQYSILSIPHLNP